MYYLNIWHEDEAFFRGFTFDTFEQMATFILDFQHEHNNEQWIFEYCTMETLALAYN